jgi:hypothetical protein
MNPTQLSIASTSTIDKRLAEFGENPDPNWRIKSFDAAVGESGTPVISLLAERDPNAGGYHGRINRGRVIVLPTDKMPAKIEELGKHPEHPMNPVDCKILMLPGKPSKGGDKDAPAPLVAHAAVLFLG